MIVSDSFGSTPKASIAIGWSISWITFKAKSENVSLFFILTLIVGRCSEKEIRGARSKKSRNAECLELKTQHWVGCCFGKTVCGRARSDYRRDGTFMFKIVLDLDSKAHVRMCGCKDSLLIVFCSQQTVNIIQSREVMASLVNKDCNDYIGQTSLVAFLLRSQLRSSWMRSKQSNRNTYCGRKRWI